MYFIFLLGEVVHTWYTWLLNLAGTIVDLISQLFIYYKVDGMLKVVMHLWGSLFEVREFYRDSTICGLADTRIKPSGDARLSELEANADLDVVLSQFFVPIFVNWDKDPTYPVIVAKLDLGFSQIEN